MAPGEHDEPDYRMSLAAERTFLAYVRTGLALLAAGVAVATALPDAGAQTLRRALGALLVLVGGLIATTARSRYRAVDRAMRAGEPLPGVSLASPLALVMAIVSVGALFVVLRG